MTYPFPDYDHVHISEREAPHRWPDGQQDSDGWEDCLFTSWVEEERFAGGDAPATLAEAEALRDDSGVAPMGPSSIAKVSVGSRKRYGHTFRQGRGWAALKALKPGQAAVVAGSLAHFPKGHTLRRWDKDYDGGHGLVVYRFPGRWWWCDPLAPRDYPGQWVSDADVERFQYDGSLFAYADRNEFKPEPASPPPPEVDMVPFIDARSREVDLPAGTVLLDLARKSARTLPAAATVISPFVVDATHRAAFASIDGVDQLVLVKRTPAIDKSARVTQEVDGLVVAAKTEAAAGAATAAAKDILAAQTKATGARSIALQDAAEASAKAIKALPR